MALKTCGQELPQTLFGLPVIISESVPPNEYILKTPSGGKIRLSCFTIKARKFVMNEFEKAN